VTGWLPISEVLHGTNGEGLGRGGGEFESSPPSKSQNPRSQAYNRRGSGGVAPGRGDIEDRVDDIALGVGGRASHPAPTREGRHQISDQLPLLVTEILLTRLPGLRRATPIPSHTRSLRGTNTRAPQTSANFHNSL
jgi:hypothetical protein